MSAIVIQNVNIHKKKMRIRKSTTVYICYNCRLSNFQIFRVKSFSLFISEIGSDFKHYGTRFSMPGTPWPIPKDKMWYSYDIGLVHFIR